MDLARALFPPLCASRNAEGSVCNNRVPNEGDRCDQCWRELASHDGVGIRATLAHEPNLPEHALARLVRDPIMAVRIAAAERADLDPLSQVRLANDDQIAVARALAANAHLCDAAAEVLAGRPDPLLQRQLQMRANALHYEPIPLAQQLGL